MKAPEGWTQVAWMVEFENGAVELWPLTDYTSEPPFGETVTPLYAPTSGDTP